jgi:hypothetical protein
LQIEERKDVLNKAGITEAGESERGKHIRQGNPGGKAGITDV